MRRDNTHVFIFTGLAAIAVVLLCAVLVSVKIEETSADGSVYNGKVREWVSPDGAHYWIFDGLKKRAVVPRYTDEGGAIMFTNETD